MPLTILKVYAIYCHTFRMRTPFTLVAFDLDLPEVGVWPHSTPEVSTPHPAKVEELLELPKTTPVPPPKPEKEVG